MFFSALTKTLQVQEIMELDIHAMQQEDSKSVQLIHIIDRVKAAE